MTGGGLARADGLTPRDADALERCVAGGGVAIFPADTVYGLATDPESKEGVQRLYALKRRPSDMPSAVMFFALSTALATLVELGPRTRRAFERLLPGPLTLLVPNPARRFPLACGSEPDRLGVRVPLLEGRLSALREVGRPVLQSSANVHGGPDPRRLADVPSGISAAADLELDGGELPGVASTVVDLAVYEADGAYAILRAGAVDEGELAGLL